MKSFKDNKGRDWSCDVTVGALKRIRDNVQVDGKPVNLGDATTLHASWQKLRGDDLFVIEAAWQIVRPRADVLQVSEEDFTESMRGDVIATAADSIIEGLTSFFRHPGIRDTLKRIDAIAREQIEKGLPQLPNPSASSSSNTSTESPASLASTPTG